MKIIGKRKKCLIIQYIENIEIFKKRYIKSQLKRIYSFSVEYDKKICINTLKNRFGDANHNSCGI